jgi:fumarate hydratase class II
MSDGPGQMRQSIWGEMKNFKERCNNPHDPTLTRTETDSTEAVCVPSDRYWGARTQRALENSSQHHGPIPRSLIHAFGFQKEACARVDASLGLLCPPLADAIIRATRELAAGQLDDHFPLSIWQTGAPIFSSPRAPRNF